MKKTCSRVLAATAALGMVLVAGCGGGGIDRDALGETPEGQAFLFRDAVMTLVAAKMLTVGDMARGDIPADDAVFAKAAADLTVLAGMVTEGFMPQGIPQGSRAMPEIWENWDDFQARAQDFQKAAQAVADAAKNGGLEGARNLVRPLQQTCGGCHSTYRAPEN
ncbi:MAG TPA: cytochrome c [Gammaproteobacteria bacterium]